jgi:hypothetical protein
MERTNFFLGAVVSNYKRHEREVMPQYFKLAKKVESGAAFIINQIGYDSRKQDELLKYMRLRNLNVAVREWNEELVFLHKIVEGAADKSYGIHVAQLAGVPGEVLERAREVLAELESRHVQSKRKGGRKRARPGFPTLFADLNETETP